MKKNAPHANFNFYGLQILTTILFLNVSGLVTTVHFSIVLALLASSTTGSTLIVLSVSLYNNVLRCTESHPLPCAAHTGLRTVGPHCRLYSLRTGVHSLYTRCTHHPNSFSYHAQVWRIQKCNFEPILAPSAVHSPGKRVS